MRATARRVTTESPGMASRLDGAVALDDVVRRAQSGDVAAFETLYRAHAPAIYLLCHRMTRDEREARELTQDAFVRAWERLPSFRGDSAIGTWLHRLAVNVVLNRFRADRRRELTSLTDDLPAPRTAGSNLGADDRIDLDAAIGQLPNGARTVFVLHDLCGYSHDEIADMTGIAAGTARAQLWRARRALLSILAP
ncbi:MAG TPA: sigma-70 family RNA polymerase sigma factor [Gemmatimonadaceae bacterium]|nr:sigma-70 family RNA polymerase sigma factor [Gemmatimonadaceae bacterium]